jgi:replicative DNA helicase
MTDRKDVNDLHREGKLPAHPSQGTERVALRVVQHDERRPTEPADLAAERALLGALLWAGANAPEVLRAAAVADLLEGGEPFYDARYGAVYDACHAAHKAGAEHDAVAVAAELARAGKGGLLGGAEGLEALKDAASTVSTAQARVYAQRIRELWARRTALADARKLAEAARDPKVEPAVLLERAQAAAANYARRTAAVASIVSIKHSLAAFIGSLQTGKNEAMPTGLRQVDEITNGGLRPRETSILAARPNVGKSNLSAQFAEAMVAADPSMVAVIYTLEMRHEMYAARLLSARAGVPMQNFRRMVISPSQWEAIHKGVAALAERGLYFADSPSQTLAQVFASLETFTRMLAQEGRRIGLAVIDHVGLVKPSAEALKRASREQQVAETSRALRAIADKYHCHAMGIAHINRSSESAPDALPGIHQLRESGALEGDADNVFILHRERDPKTRQFRKDKPAAFALGKGRLDETGVCLLGYDGAHARFTDYTGPEEFEQVYGD